MVSEMFITMLTPMSQTLGIGATALSYLFAFAFAFGIAAAIAWKFGPQLALPGFFLMLLIMTFIGAFDWLMLVLPLVLVGAYYLKGGGN